jgi:hypothetical protein
MLPILFLQSGSSCFVNTPTSEFSDSPRAAVSTVSPECVWVGDRGLLTAGATSLLYPVVCLQRQPPAWPTEVESVKRNPWGSQPEHPQMKLVIAK